jgi:hypothetical protein
VPSHAQQRLCLHDALACPYAHAHTQHSTSWRAKRKTATRQCVARAQILGESTSSSAAGSRGITGSLGSNLSMRSKKAALLRASLGPSSKAKPAAAAGQAAGRGTNWKGAPAGASMPAHRSSPSKQPGQPAGYGAAGRLQPQAPASTNNSAAAVEQLDGSALAALVMQVSNV